MTSREAAKWTFGLAIAVIIGVIAGRLIFFKALVVPPPITLQVVFDGGYTFDFTGSDAVNVHALTKASYPMKVKLMTTTGTPEIDVTGYTLAILPDGTAPARSKPGLPPSDPTQVGCDGTNDQIKVNNRLFIPDLADIASRMGTTIKSALDRAATFELTGGGALSVRRVGGCVEYRDVKNDPISALPKRSMASGIGGIMFEWPHVASQKIVLQRTPLGGGPPLLTDVTPDASNLILIRASSFGLSSNTAGAPHLIAHFKDHFDDAFTTIDETKRISLFWLGTYLVSPGIDCPPGGF